MNADSVMAPAIEITGLSKSYGAVPVLHAMDFAVPTGSVTAVLGASGSGKTTLLRLIAGFERADRGRITIAGKVVDDGHRATAPRRRGIGYVPQDGALFPHMTVRGNISFGLARGERHLVRELTALVGLAGLEHRYPHQLSGGQQQRVALARALAIRPKVVLLDEPFSSLEARLRESMRADVMRILAAAQATTVLVTHDQEEALSLADQVTLLEGGRVLAHGSPRSLYDRPATPAVAAAIGTATVLDAVLDGSLLRCALGEFVTDRRGAPGPVPCRVMVRPEQLLISSSPNGARLAADVVRVRYQGSAALVDLAGHDPGLPALVARVDAGTELTKGQIVWLSTAVPPHIWI